jgi:hypothetical protein
MTERLGIKTAAERLGVSSDTIRRRLVRGELPGEREPTPQGYRWVVLLPGTTERTPAPPGAGSPADAATLRERCAGLERLSAELAADRDAWRDRAAQDADAARELRVLLGRAQAFERAIPPGATIPAGGQALLTPSRWQRLRHRLRGT